MTILFITIEDWKHKANVSLSIVEGLSKIWYICSIGYL